MIRYAAVLNGVPYEEPKLEGVFGPMYAIERRVVVEHWLDALSELREHCERLVDEVGDPRGARPSWNAAAARELAQRGEIHDVVIDLANETYGVGPLRILLSAREVQLRRALDVLDLTLED